MDQENTNDNASYTLWITEGGGGKGKRLGLGGDTTRGEKKNQRRNDWGGGEDVLGTKRPNIRSTWPVGCQTLRPLTI